jgi:hypothetical protein
MYVLYFSTVTFILFTIYNCFSKNKAKNLPLKFDNKNDYLFKITNIEFFKNGELIKTKDYNNYYDQQIQIEINVDFSYDFFIVNYIYENTDYKYYSESNLLTFPIYKSEQIKNYVYINKITSATILVPESNEIIDILSLIIPFIGPNYNFYNDLEHFNTELQIDKILTYFKYNNKIMLDKVDIKNKNYKIVFYDNFNNEYILDSNYFIWNPQLKL